ncbi:MAG: hypothetical protein ACD_73C00063G0005 [uncultured bacterium]|nr:MAG: hypothetical protein ACD_73C00063G0005 [uncultured bacterium]
MKQIPVNLKERTYQITIGPDTIQKLAFKSGAHIVTNTTVYELYYKKIHSLLKKQKIKAHWIIIKDGEKYKTLKTVESIYHQLLIQKANRKSILLALGGGVVGDMCGFAAATYLRGIDFIQIPTTLLAQVDSSVGGKTGVDLKEGKNLIGAFYQPKAVIIDTDFLKTLPQREFLCGLAEVIKYGLLWDASFFDLLEKNVGAILALENNILTQIIARSCEIKAEIVSKDEKESNLRALLNLGHTLGHAIETLSGYSKILHGEAISMGMVYAAILSHKLGYLSALEVTRIQKLFTAFGLPTKWPKIATSSYRQAISVDKKSLGEKINYVAIKKIGKTFLLPLSPKEIIKYI